MTFLVKYQTFEGKLVPMTDVIEFSAIFAGSSQAKSIQLRNTLPTNGKILRVECSNPSILPTFRNPLLNPEGTTTIEVTINVANNDSKLAEMVKIQISPDGNLLLFYCGRLTL